jgi:TonB family protein
MFGKILLTAIILSAFCLTAKAQTENKTAAQPVLNGAAKYLPKPDYPREAKDACAYGLVEVEVLIDENGDVISAEAVTGDELLRASAVEAAKKAKFKQTIHGAPVKLKGIIVYNFVSEKKCIKMGVINKKALSIPKPQVKNAISPKRLRISKEETVHVLVIIDVLTGKVTKATAVSGHPMLRAVCEVSARQAKFSPFYHGEGIFVKAIIAYKFKPDGKIEF